MTQLYKAQGITPIRCDDWEALVSQFELLGRGWIFRGHASANWRLRTTLDRQTPFGYQKRDAEEDLLRAFRRRAHNFLAAEHLPADDMSGEWLALMQHFGAPTRLLDFTHDLQREGARILTGPHLTGELESADHAVPVQITYGWTNVNMSSVVLWID